MDQNFWFSPGGQALLSVLGSLRIGPRKEVLRGGIRPFAPLETYFRLRGAEQLLSQLPQEYQPFARMAIYSGVPIDLAGIYETAQRERKKGEYAEFLAKELGVSPDFAKLVVSNVVPLSEAIQKKILSELPQKHEQIRAAIAKHSRGEELSPQEVALLEEYKQFVPIYHEQMKNKWIRDRANEILNQLDPNHPTARAINEALSSGDNKALADILKKDYPIAATRLKALEEIQKGVDEVVREGKTDSLYKAMTKYSMWDVLTRDDVNIISGLVDSVHSPELASKLATWYREKLLPSIRERELKEHAKLLISGYENGLYDTRTFLGGISQIVRTDVNIAERLERVREREAKGDDVSEIMKLINQEYQSLVRKMNEIGGYTREFKFVSPSMIASVKSDLNQFEKILDMYKNLDPQRMQFFKTQVDHFRRKIEEIEGKTKGKTKGEEVNVEKLVKDLFKR